MGKTIIGGVLRALFASLLQAGESAKVLLLAVFVHHYTPLVGRSVPADATYAGRASSAPVAEGSSGQSRSRRGAAHFSKWVHGLLRLRVSRLCKFSGVVITKVVCLVVDGYACLKGGAFFINAKQLGRAIFVRAPLVLGVLRLIGFAEIGNRIVRLTSVAVVQLGGRPAAIKNKPRQPVGHPVFSVNADNAVAFFIHTACNSAGRYHAMPSGPAFPEEKAGGFVVVKKFAHACAGKICLSHDGSYTAGLIRARAVLVTLRGLVHFRPDARGAV